MEVDIGVADKFVLSAIDLSTKTRETEVLSFSFAETDGKIEKRVEIGALGFPTTEVGEIVRVYINLDNPSLLDIVRDAFRVALQPFLVGRPDLTFGETSEGFKIIRGCQCAG
jgi:hypothetical protein